MIIGTSMIFIVVIFLRVCLVRSTFIGSKVKQWGINDEFRIGTSDEEVVSPRIIDNFGMLEGIEIKDVCNTNHNVVLLTEDNILYAWGSNNDHLLSSDTPVPQMIDTNFTSGNDIIGISCGFDSVLLKVDRSIMQIYGWGENKYGVFGDYSTSYSESPKLIMLGQIKHYELSKYTSLLTYKNHKGEERILTSGSQNAFTLGYDSSSNRYNFEVVDIDHFERIRKVFNLNRVVFVVYEDEVIYGWGDSKLFLTIGTADTPQRIPVEIQFFKSNNLRVLDIACELTCVAIVQKILPVDNERKNKVLSWGFEGVSEEFYLGREDSSSNYYIPTEIYYGDLPEDEEIRRVSSTSDGFLFTTDKGNLFAFGLNQNYLFGREDKGYASFLLKKVKDVYANVTYISSWTSTFFTLLEGPTCFGMAFNDETACSGHGVCGKDGQCTCSDPYKVLPNCSLAHSCHGHLNTSSPVCNFRNGSCISQDVCICKDGYVGTACETPFCGGVIGNNTDSVCRGHGICVLHDICVCDSFVGKECEEEIGSAKICLQKNWVRILFKSPWLLISSKGLNATFDCGLIVKDASILGSCENSDCCYFVKEGDTRKRRGNTGEEEYSEELVVLISEGHEVEIYSVLSVSPVSQLGEVFVDIVVIEELVVVDNENGFSKSGTEENPVNYVLFSSLATIPICFGLMCFILCVVGCVVCYYTFGCCFCWSCLCCAFSTATSTTGAAVGKNSSPNNETKELDMLTFSSAFQNSREKKSSAEKKRRRMSLSPSIDDFMDPVSPSASNPISGDPSVSKRPVLPPLMTRSSSSMKKMGVELENIEIGSIFDRDFSDPDLVYVPNHEIGFNKSIGKVEVHKSISYEVQKFKANWKGTEVMFFNVKFPGIATRKFREELVDLSRIKHPNILKYMGSTISRPSMTSSVKSSVFSNGIGIITETTKYSNLKVFSDSRKYVYGGDGITFIQKLNFLYGVADAMCFLHAQDRVLYELKPENLFVNQDLNVKVNPFVFYRSETIPECQTTQADSFLMSPTSMKDDLSGSVVRSRKMSGRKYKNARRRRSSTAGFFLGTSSSSMNGNPAPSSPEPDVVMSPSSILSDDGRERIGADNPRGRLFYHVSPERLRTSVSSLEEFSLVDKQKCDVYSFGILIQMIMSNEFSYPYGHFPDWRSLRNRIANNPEYRPKIRPGDYYQKKWLLDLTRICWSHDVTLRPSFSAIIGNWFEKNKWNEVKIKEKGWYRRSHHYHKDVLNSSSLQDDINIHVSSANSSGCSSPTLSEVSSSSNFSGFPYPMNKRMMSRSKSSLTVRELNSTINSPPNNNVRCADSSPTPKDEDGIQQMKRFSLSHSLIVPSRSHFNGSNFMMNGSVNQRGSKTPTVSPRNSYHFDDYDHLDLLKKGRHRSVDNDLRESTRMLLFDGKGVPQPQPQPQPPPHNAMKGSGRRRSRSTNNLRNSRSFGRKRLSLLNHRGKNNNLQFLEEDDTKETIVLMLEEKMNLREEQWKETLIQQGKELEETNERVRNLEEKLYYYESRDETSSVNASSRSRKKEDCDSEVGIEKQSEEQEEEEEEERSTVEEEVRSTVEEEGVESDVDDDSRIMFLKILEKQRTNSTELQLKKEDLMADEDNSEESSSNESASSSNRSTSENNEEEEETEEETEESEEKKSDSDSDDRTESSTSDDGDEDESEEEKKERKNRRNKKGSSFEEEDVVI